MQCAPLFTAEKVEALVIHVHAVYTLLLPCGAQVLSLYISFTACTELLLVWFVSRSGSFLNDRVLQRHSGCLNANLPCVSIVTIRIEMSYA